MAAELTRRGCRSGSHCSSDLLLNRPLQVGLHVEHHPQHLTHGAHLLSVRGQLATNAEARVRERHSCSLSTHDGQGVRLGVDVQLGHLERKGGAGRIYKETIKGKEGWGRGRRRRGEGKWKDVATVYGAAESF